MTCNKPPSSDALHGTCRGSVEPQSEGGSPRALPYIDPETNLMRNNIDWRPEVGDLVFAWSILEEDYIPYQYEAELCSKITPMCWLINLIDGRRIKKKIRDLWIPRI